MNRWEVQVGDCVELMKALDDASFDAVLTDPPYGLQFMGQSWDHIERGEKMEEWHRRWAKQALRVLKPGGYLLAFGGSRTNHRLASAVEDVGFELRDSVLWLYGAGFPKSRDIGKDTPEGEGWGTALKPAHEPIIMGRKPFSGSVAENFLEHGTGAINIEACRIDFASAEAYGRWPANLAISHTEECEDDNCAPGCPVLTLNEQAGVRRGGGYPAERGNNSIFNKASGGSAGPRSMGDTGGPARFFYCGKTSRSERDAGLDETFAVKPLNWSSGEQSPGTFQSEGTEKAARNNHPTVKPIDVMRWLCRMVTPEGGLILDPFVGSGTTGCAAVLEGFRFVGYEKQQEYQRIAAARIKHWSLFEGNDTERALASSVRAQTRLEAGQIGLLDKEA